MVAGSKTLARLAEGVPLPLIVPETRYYAVGSWKHPVAGQGAGRPAPGCDPRDTPRFCGLACNLLKKGGLFPPVQVEPRSVPHLRALERRCQAQIFRCSCAG